MVTKRKNLHRRWSVEKESVKKVSRRQALQRPRESIRSSSPVGVRRVRRIVRD